MFFTTLIAALLAADVGDTTDKAWKARAEKATQKLSKPGLDACDRAVEVAYQKPKVSASAGSRMYALEIRIEGEAMFAAYTYEGRKLTDFSIMGLPARWMVHQQADSKTLSVVLGSGPACAFDLCTNDPFADGPCPEKR